MGGHENKWSRLISDIELQVTRPMLPYLRDGSGKVNGGHAGDMRYRLGGRPRLDSQRSVGNKEKVQEAIATQMLQNARRGTWGFEEC